MGFFKLIVELVMHSFIFVCSQDYTCPRCDSGFIEELLEERRCVL